MAEGATSEAGSRAEVSPREPRPTRGNFVGREREFAELRPALAAACAGRGGLFLLAGESGIGKTRLASELADEATRRGALVVGGRCWEGGGAPAYWPWVEALRACLRGVEAGALAGRIGSAMADVALLVPELRARVPGLPEPAPPPDPERARFHLFDATAAFLRAVAEVRPLMVVLDDLHAADRPSLLLLQFLAREVHTAPLLVVGCYRDVEVRQAPELSVILGEVARDAHTVPLRGLTESEVARLISQVTARPVAEALVRAVHRATEGNPFFVEEVVKLLDADGRLEGVGGHLPIPDSVRVAIRRRLGRLSDDCARLLTCAAIMGREFDLGALARVMGRPSGSLVDAITEAHAAGLVAELPGTLARLAFSHALVRETLCEDLPPGERARLHLRVGQALEALHRSDSEVHLAELAHHFFMAAVVGGDVTRAADYCVRAAERAGRELAVEEAVEHYERALQVLTMGEPEDVRRCDVLLALGEAQEQVGDFARARRTFGEAAIMARKLGDRTALARAALGPGGQWALKMTSTVFEKSDIALLEEALGVVPPGDDSLRSRVLARLGLALCFAGASARGEKLSREAVEMARRIGDVAALAHALSARHAVLLGPDHVEARVEVAAEVARLARETGDRELTLRGHVLRMHDLAERGDVAAAELELGEYARLAKSLRDPFEQWLGTTCKATWALFHGRIAESERLAGEALAIARRTPGQQGAEENAGMCFTVQIVLVRREQARLDEIEGAVRRFADDYPGVPGWRALLSVVLADLGRDAHARSEIERLAVDGFARIHRDSTWLGVTCLVAEVCAALGDAALAAQLYDLLAPFRDRNAGLTTPLRLGSAARFLGLLAATQGRQDVASEQFELALTTNARFGASLWLAHTQVDYAATLAARGGAANAARAAELMAAARASAPGLGSARLDRRLAALDVHEGEERDAPRLVAVSAMGAPDSVNGVPPPASTFRREGDYWTIAYDGSVFRLRHAKGLACLAHLLGYPDRDFHAGELVALIGAKGGGSPESDVCGETFVGDDYLFDARARSSYKQRLGDLREALDDARERGDAERAACIQEEIDSLGRELARGLGIGGRHRRAGSATERARVSVTRAIKGALARIHDHHPSLGSHLLRTVRTGTFCAYTPDPRRPVAWKT